MLQYLTHKGHGEEVVGGRWTHCTAKHVGQIFAAAISTCFKTHNTNLIEQFLEVAFQEAERE